MSDEVNQPMAENRREQHPGSMRISEAPTHIAEQGRPDHIGEQAVTARVSWASKGFTGSQAWRQAQVRESCENQGGPQEIGWQHVTKPSRSARPLQGLRMLVGDVAVARLLACETDDCARNCAPSGNAGQ